MNFASSGRQFAGAIALAISSLMVQANAQGSKTHFDVPAQPLSQSLRAIAEAGHVNVLFDTARIADQSAPALSGSYTVDEALAILLAGSGFAPQYLDAKTVVLEPVSEKSGNADASIRLAQNDAPSSPPAGSEPAQSVGGIEEILVTAQKREERLQDVPIAITAIPGDALERMGARDIGDLTSVTPNVTFQPVSVVPTAAITFIRGIGERSVENTTDQPNAISIDGVYLQGSHGGLLDVFDVERVEVLRGPQGTLQGRNATGGAINIITRRPSLQKLGFRGEIDFGRFDTWVAKASVDGPIIADTLAAKFSMITTDSDGFMDNEYTGGTVGGRRYTIARMGLLYQPSDNFDLYLTGDYVWDRSQQPPARNATDGIDYPRQETGGQGVSVICSVFEVCTPDPRGTVRSAYTDRNSTDQGVVSLTANWDTGPLTLTSVSGYRKLRDHVRLDLDFTPLEFLTVEDEYTKGETWSQEIRVASNENGGLDLDGRLNWVAGLYYYHDKWTHDSNVCLPALGIPCPAPLVIRAQKLKSYAAFAHVDYSLTDQWEIFGGARYTKDKKHFRHISAPAVNAKDDWSEVTAEAGVRYHFNDDTMTYFRFSQGYRAGGFNNSGVTYDPETVDSYEVGLKSLLWDRRLSLNAAVFYYDYKDLQRGVVLPHNAPPFYIQGTLNAAEVTIKGAELEATVQPIRQLRLWTSIGYLDSKYDEYIDNVINPDGSLTPVDNSGLRLPYSSKWTTSTGADYTFDLGPSLPFDELTISADYQYRTRFTTNPTDLPVGAQSGYGLLNASLRFASDRYSLTLYGQNLTDKYYIIAGEHNGGLNLYQVEGMPRTYGVRFGVSFD